MYIIFITLCNRCRSVARPSVHHPGEFAARRRARHMLRTYEHQLRAATGGAVIRLRVAGDSEAEGEHERIFPVSLHPAEAPALRSHFLQYRRAHLGSPIH